MIKIQELQEMEITGDCVMSVLKVPFNLLLAHVEHRAGAWSLRVTRI